MLYLFRKTLLASLILIIMVFAGAQPALAEPFGVNLIVNGNAEAAAGSPTGFTVVSVPGFTTTGNFTVISYSAGGGFPTPTDPGPPDRGNNFFAGGPDNAFSSATQFIDVSSGASGIDTGTATFNLSAYLGGFATQGDNAVLSVSFLNATNDVLGTTSLGPVTAADRTFITGLLLRTTSGFVPTGTRGINVTLNMTRTEGSYNDGYADNLSLVLNSQQVPPTAVPEPATMTLLITGLTGLGAAVRRRRKADKGEAAQSRVVE